MATPQGTEASRAHGDAAGPVLMLIDDEPTCLAVHAEFLRGQGFASVVCVEDATQALDFLGEVQPDLLLLDLVMPGVSGLEILAHMRADHALSAIPVIVLSSASEDDVRDEAMRLGADDFVPKPADLDVLLRRVRDALGEKGAVAS